MSRVIMDVIVTGKMSPVHPIVGLVLVTTYWLLLCVGLVGLWMVMTAFGTGEDHLPPPPPVFVPATTPEPYVEQYTQYGHRHTQDSISREEDQVYQQYVSDTYRHANYGLDPRLYLVLPCGACVVAAGVLAMAGIFSMAVFSTTASLHTSAVLWVLTLATTLVYNSLLSWWDVQLDALLLTSSWVVGIHTALLLVLSLQVLLATWELRRQRTGWPTFQLSNVFTLGALMLTTRLVLALYQAANFFQSWMMTGVHEASDSESWYSPVFKYPELYVFLCSTACVYGATVAVQDTLSHFMGPVHSHLMGFTDVISAIFHGCVAVVASPLFVEAFVGSYLVSPVIMILAIVVCNVTFAQAIVCLVVPNVLWTPPLVIRTIASHLSSMDLFEGVVEADETQSCQSATEKNPGYPIARIVNILLLA
ncbi:hypothetical protein Hamer_G016870, partial [Homarus americanus]